MNIKPQHLKLLLVGALSVLLLLLGVVLPLSAARGKLDIAAPSMPATLNDLVNLDSTYVGQVKLLWAAPGVYSDNLTPPTSTVDLGNIDLGFLLNCTSPNLMGYVDLSTTLVFTQEHIVTTTQAVTTPLAVGPAVSGTCNGTNIEIQSERFAWVTGAGQSVTRQFRLIGVRTGLTSYAGEYRETLWGYGPQPYTIVGELDMTLASGENLALLNRIYLPLVRR